MLFDQLLNYLRIVVKYQDWFSDSLEPQLCIRTSCLILLRITQRHTDIYTHTQNLWLSGSISNNHPTLDITWQSTTFCLDEEFFRWTLKLLLLVYQVLLCITLHLNHQFNHKNCMNLNYLLCFSSSLTIISKLLEHLNEFQCF